MLKDLMPLTPHKTLPPQRHKPIVSLMSRKVSEKEVRREGKAFLLFNKEVKHDSATIDPRITELLEQYADVFPEDLPKGLPPIRGIDSTKLTSYQELHSLTNLYTEPILKRQRSCKGKYKR